LTCHWADRRTGSVDKGQDHRAAVVQLILQGDGLAIIPHHHHGRERESAVDVIASRIMRWWACGSASSRANEARGLLKRRGGAVSIIRQVMAFRRFVLYGPGEVSGEWDAGCVGVERQADGCVVHGMKRRLPRHSMGTDAASSRPLRHLSHFGFESVHAQSLTFNHSVANGECGKTSALIASPPDCASTQFRWTVPLPQNTRCR
jgi:hypothetical protein